jgi:3-oxoacyl-[acyl-carrier protein] reductase
VYADLNAEGSRDAAATVDPAGTSTLAVELDVRELDSVQACLEAAIERWGHVDAWVNNAAMTLARSFFEIDPSEWDDVIATNLRGTYFGCRVAGLHMRERGTGRIVNLSSIAGQRGASVNGVPLRGLEAGIVAITASQPRARSVRRHRPALAPAAIRGPASPPCPRTRSPPWSGRFRWAVSAGGRVAHSSRFVSDDAASSPARPMASTAAC